MFDIFLDTSLVLIIQQMPSPLLQIHEKGLRSVFDNKWNNSYCVEFVGGTTDISFYRKLTDAVIWKKSKKLLKLSKWIGNVFYLADKNENSLKFDGNNAQLFTYSCHEFSNLPWLSFVFVAACFFCFFFESLWHEQNFHFCYFCWYSKGTVRSKAIFRQLKDL